MSKKRSRKGQAQGFMEAEGKLAVSPFVNMFTLPGSLSSTISSALCLTTSVQGSNASSMPAAPILTNRSWAQVIIVFLIVY